MRTSHFLSMIPVFFGLALTAESAAAKPASTVSGLPLVNAHEVVPGRVYRGAQPGKKTGTLLAFGITDVLIIKNDTKGEVATEIEDLESQGLSSENIQTFAVEWKDVVSEQKNCKLFVKALKVVRKVLQSSDRRLYFHCSVGEDRTGLLAGLVRMLEEGWTAKAAFQDEMCAHGYADGQGKPFSVARDVKEGLNPTFAKLASAIESGALSWENLNESVCNRAADPSDVDDWSCR